MRLRKNKMVAIELLDHCVGGGEPIVACIYGEISNLGRKHVEVVSCGLIKGIRGEQKDELFTIVRKAIQRIYPLEIDEDTEPTEDSVVMIEYVSSNNLFRVYGRIINLTAKSIELSSWETIGQNSVTTVLNDERSTVVRSSMKHIVCLKEKKI